MVEFLMCADLSWHMHQENSSDGSLSLTVALLRTMQCISLKHTEQVLLPACENIYIGSCLAALLVSVTMHMTIGSAYP